MILGSRKIQQIDWKIQKTGLKIHHTRWKIHHIGSKSHHTRWKTHHIGWKILKSESQNLIPLGIESSPPVPWFLCQPLH